MDKIIQIIEINENEKTIIRLADINIQGYNIAKCVYEGSGNLTLIKKGKSDKMTPSYFYPSTDNGANIISNTCFRHYRDGLTMVEVAPINCSGKIILTYELIYVNVNDNNENNNNIMNEMTQYYKKYFVFAPHFGINYDQFENFEHHPNDIYKQINSDCQLQKSSRANTYEIMHSHDIITGFTFNVLTLNMPTDIKCCISANMTRLYNFELKQGQTYLKFLLFGRKLAYSKIYFEFDRLIDCTIIQHNLSFTSEIPELINDKLGIIAQHNVVQVYFNNMVANE